MATSRGGPAVGLGFWLFWTPTVLAGVVAIVLGVWGWSMVVKPFDAETWSDLVSRLGDVMVRSVKSPLLSDIYYEEWIHEARAATGFPVLETSRDLGVLFAVLVAARVLLFAVTSMSLGVAMRWRKGHDIVLGETEAAEQYAAETANVDKREVTYIKEIERNRRGRLALLRRDAPVERELIDAGYKGARRIMIAEETDEQSWATAQIAARLAPRNVQVLVYVSDFWVNERFSRSLLLRSFSYEGGVARQVILAHPPYLLARRLKAAAQHIIVVGFGAVAQAIVREFLLSCVSVSPERMMVTVICSDIVAAECEFDERCPGFKQGAAGGGVDIAFLEGDVSTGVGRGRRRSGEAFTDTEHYLDRDLAERCMESPPAAVYIALEAEELPLRTAIIFRERAIRERWFSAPIFIWRAGGLETVAHGAGVVGEFDDKSNPRTQTGLLSGLGLYGFGSWRDAFDGEGLFEPELDGRAKEFHAMYQAEMKRTNPADTTPDWSKLGEEFRVSNRRVAAHIRAKLDAVGYDLDAWLARRSDYHTHDLPVGAEKEIELESVEEMNRLAELEHRRWSLDRVLNGWTYGDPRDNFRKLHPKLIPFEDLDEGEKEKDRRNIRQTAKILKHVVAKGAAASTHR
ncbi:hypothetical protein GC169_05275 [bacterium]|nr:hypothetical protein [bacterium]